MRVDLGEWKKLVKDLDGLPTDVVAEAGDYFKRITPKDTGNARSRTSTKKTVIEADYAYAGRLDEGYSRQAPQGMTEPTMKKMEKIVNDKVGRL